MIHLNMFRLGCLCACVLALAATAAQAESTKVNVMNYIAAQTAMQFDSYQKQAGGVNKVLNIRKPVRIDNQPTIRMNRDTFHSFIVIDISEGATVTMPDAGPRYHSMMMVMRLYWPTKAALNGSWQSPAIKAAK